MSTATNLTKIVTRVLQFEYNAGLEVIFTAIYGHCDYKDAYIKEKLNQIKTRGFSSWLSTLVNDASADS